eukprot:3768903-Prymnesium_polylepis.1
MCIRDSTCHGRCAQIPLGSLLVSVANPLLKMIIDMLTVREGLDTATEEQRSLFSKLSLT